MAKTVLVAGASGLVGFAAMRAFEEEPGTRVIATSRREPLALAGAEWIACDLTDQAACERLFGALREVTHLVFAALFEKPQVIPGWLDPEQIETNGRMLRNLFEPLRRAAVGLEHVILLQGTKAYGAHVRPMEVPARPGRSEARDVPNFYWVQEDYLRDQQAGDDWGLTVLRPQIVFGVAVGGALNPIAAIGAYAALLKEAGEPLHFPGGKAPFVLEAVHADLIADAIVWATNDRISHGKAYNLTNGDVMTFRGVWPAIADAFGMAVGEDRPQRLAETMAGRGGDWRRLAERHGLRAPDLGAFVAQSFQYADFLLAPGRDEIHGAVPPIVSTINLRQDGFHAVWDSEDMLRDVVGQFRALKFLPPR